MDFEMRARRDTLVFDAILYRDKGLEVTPSIVVIERSFGRLPWPRSRVIPVEDIERVSHAYTQRAVPWRSRLRSALSVRSRDPDSVDSVIQVDRKLILSMHGGRVRHAVDADKPVDAFKALRRAMRT